MNCSPGTTRQPSFGKPTWKPTRLCSICLAASAAPANVREFVRHIWGAELRWAQRLAGIPETPREQIPAGPLDALFGLHLQAVEIFRSLLAAPEESWNDPYVLKFDWVPEDQRKVSRRKIGGHALFHSQRHWAQLATLVRNAGFPSNFRGDLLFSPALR